MSRLISIVRAATVELVLSQRNRLRAVNWGYWIHWQFLNSGVCLSAVCVKCYQSSTVCLEIRWKCSPKPATKMENERSSRSLACQFEQRNKKIVIKFILNSKWNKCRALRENLGQFIQFQFVNACSWAYSSRTQTLKRETRKKCDCVANQTKSRFEHECERLVWVFIFSFFFKINCTVENRFSVHCSARLIPDEHVTIKLSRVN